VDGSVYREVRGEPAPVPEVRMQGEAV
jgi:hypothetical protein